MHLFVCLFGALIQNFQGVGLFEFMDFDCEKLKLPIF